MKILILPGLDGDARLRDDFCAALPDQFEARAIGYPASLAKFEQYVDFARAAIRASGECVLVAESFSGPIAIELLRAPPPELKAIVLVATFATAPFRLLLRTVAQVPGFALTALGALAMDYFCLNGFGNRAIAKRVKVVVNALPSCVVKMRLRVLSSLPDDLIALIKQRSIPAYLLRPLNDRLIPARHSLEIEQSLPRASTVYINGPHFLLQCRPHESAGAVADFVMRLG